MMTPERSPAITDEESLDETNERPGGKATEKEKGKQKSASILQRSCVELT